MGNETSQAPPPHARDGCQPSSFSSHWRSRSVGLPLATSPRPARCDRTTLAGPHSHPELGGRSGPAARPSAHRPRKGLWNRCSSGHQILLFWPKSIFAEIHAETFKDDVIRPRSGGESGRRLAAVGLVAGRGGPCAPAAASGACERCRVSSPTQDPLSQGLGCSQSGLQPAPRELAAPPSATTSAFCYPISASVMFDVFHNK